MGRKLACLIHPRRAGREFVRSSAGFEERHAALDFGADRWEVFEANLVDHELVIGNSIVVQNEATLRTFG